MHQNHTKGILLSHHHVIHCMIWYKGLLLLLQWTWFCDPEQVHFEPTSAHEYNLQRTSALNHWSKHHQNFSNIAQNRDFFSAAIFCREKIAIFFTSYIAMFIDFFDNDAKNQPFSYNRGYLRGKTFFLCHFSFDLAWSWRRRALGFEKEVLRLTKKSARRF